MLKYCVMKTKYFLIFLALLLSVMFYNAAQAQCCLVMGYDAAGNRISRQVTTNCIEKRDAVEVQEVETDDGVKVYPNPNHGVFKVIVNNIKESASYELYDVNGVMLLSGNLHNDETEIDIGTTAGTYLLKISNGDDVISKIIVIN